MQKATRRDRNVDHRARPPPVLAGARGAGETGPPIRRGTSEPQRVTLRPAEDTGRFSSAGTNYGKQDESGLVGDDNVG
jgi:hypothetical protein